MDSIKNLNPWTRFTLIMAATFSLILAAWVGVSATVLTGDGSEPVATEEPGEESVVEVVKGEAMPETGLFTSTWSGLRAQLPLLPNGNYDFLIDWDDDGFADANITEWDSPDAARVFDTDAEHKVHISGILTGWSFGFYNQSSEFFAMLSDPLLVGTEEVVFYGGLLDGSAVGDVNPESIVEVSSWGPVIISEVSGFMYGTTNLKVVARDAPRFGSSSASQLFYGSGVDTINAAAWDTFGVENLSGAFAQTPNFNDPGLREWDTSSVKLLKGTFFDAIKFNADIGGWDVSKLVDASELFAGAVAFNHMLGTWKMKKIVSLDNWLLASGMEASNYAITLASWGSRKSTASGVKAASGLEPSVQTEETLSAEELLADGYKWSFERLSSGNTEPVEREVLAADQIVVIEKLFSRSDLSESGISTYLTNAGITFDIYQISDAGAGKFEGEANADRINLVFSDDVLVDAYFG